MGTPQSSAMASLPRLLLLESDDVCGTARRQPAASSPLVHPDSGVGAVHKGLCSASLKSRVCAALQQRVLESESLFGLIVWIPASKITLCSGTQVTPGLSKIASG